MGNTSSDEIASILGPPSKADMGNILFSSDIMAGTFEPPSVRGRPHSGAVRGDEHWDRPYVQGTGQLQAVSESSESVAQAALQGLTCEKKTKSILVKAADLYSK